MFVNKINGLFLNKRTYGFCRSPAADFENGVDVLREL